MNTTEAQKNTSETPTKSTLQKNVKTWLFDLLICFISATLVAGSLFYFSNYNSFAPGGVTGFASIIGSYIAKSGLGDVTSNMSILMFTFNLPIFICVSIFCNRKTGVMLIIYLLFQSALLMVFKLLNKEFGLPYYAAFSHDPLYEEGNNVVWAAIGVGVISGFGYSLMLRHFGASGGTYAISALIKRIMPEKNIAWLSFALDSSVVILALFVYDTGINAVISTLTNIFIANLVVDGILQGVRNGYKFEVITDRPDEFAAMVMERLHRGATLIHGEGMYTHTDKAIVICIVRKRQVGEFLKILKSHGATFSYSCKVNEVYGKFAINVQGDKVLFPVDKQD